MTLGSAVLLFAAGTCGGAVNAIAGGGILFILPALQMAGLGPVSAAASANLAVLPAHPIAAFAARGEITGHGRRLVSSAAVAAVGGSLGAVLLLVSGDQVFARLIPWLILTATLAFALGPRLAAFVQQQIGARHGMAALAVEFAVAVYGGYFGAGLGVMIMAALALLGWDSPRQANAVKNVLAAVITGVAVVIFMAGGAVAWRETAVALSGALAGGYVGARLANMLPPAWLRRGVVAVGALLTAYYFLR